jgi:hypothetical protein
MLEDQDKAAKTEQVAHHEEHVESDTSVSANSQ